MDRFVKGFIVMSIVYLAVSTVMGIAMVLNQEMSAFRFAHSHLNMLGWVSMMIFGVGYHILPRFVGRPLKHPVMGEVQFYVANVGLVGLLLFYTLNTYNPSETYVSFTAIFGAMEGLSIFMFIYNMLVTIVPKTEMPH